MCNCISFLQRQKAWLSGEWMVPPNLAWQSASIALESEESISAAGKLPRQVGEILLVKTELFSKKASELCHI